MRSNHADSAPRQAEVALPDRDATRRFAARLASLLRPGDVVALGGALGSGKTTLARDIIETLAGGPCEVPSPTFTLAQTYEVGGLLVWHFDLYRIGRPEEILELGFEEALAEGVALVEWPERLGPFLPGDRLEVTLVADAAPDARSVRLAGFGSWRVRLARLVSKAGD
ncbi:MAG: tRNA (adenosine(37)-N6)-threonylcarbamoyltransferase complex ATPase subunit type 1 TsaE [Alphaproteobacteria bacterium]